MWIYFSEKIKPLIEDFNADLYVSIPNSVNTGIKNSIINEYKDAHIYEFDNHGRDVLPFITIASEIIEKYAFILKIHSKKSPHFKDGAKWLDDIVESLIPNDKVKINEIVRLLNKEKTALIGPAGYYYPLAINLQANGIGLRTILRRTKGFLKARNVLKNSFDYGFFAGTMFWIQGDVLSQIVHAGFNKKYFQEEKGQIDGTFAHALERAFCLLPEIDEKNIYQIDPMGNIRMIEYNSGIIPEWSDLYTRPT